MGALRRARRPLQRHEVLRGLRAPEGASGEVRLRARPGRSGGQGAAGQAVSGGLEEGSRPPVGATPSPNGVDFSPFSVYATGAQLLLFDRVGDAQASPVV